MTHPGTLCLMNDSRAHEELYKTIRDYAAGKWSHKQYRAAIYRLIANYHDKHWSATNTAATSQICYELFMQCHGNDPAGYYNACPDWVQVHLHGIYGNYFEPPDNECEAQFCFYKPYQLGPEETQMYEDKPCAKAPTRTNAPAVEHKIFIFGQDMKTMTDGAIFDVISDLEKQVSDLSKIEHRPQRIALRIADLQAQIVLIVDTLDAADKKE